MHVNSAHSNAGSHRNDEKCACCGSSSIGTECYGDAVTTYLSTNADTSHDTACRVAIHILGGITRVSSICSEVVSLAWEEAPAEISEVSRMQNAFSHTLKVLFLV